MSDEAQEVLFGGTLRGGKFWYWVMDEFKNRVIVGSSFA